jgi:transposase InsO family protein
VQRVRDRRKRVRERKRKQQLPAKAEEKKDQNGDSDAAVWMTTVDEDSLEDGGGSFELWTKEEIDDDDWGDEGCWNVVESGCEDCLPINEHPLKVDQDDEARTFTFTAAMLANSGTSSSLEAELYDSGASRHMSPYRQKFINFVSIQKKVLTAADGGTFEATGKGDIYITLPKGKTTTRILLKDVLYSPKIGVTLVSISKIDAAGFASLFYKGCLRIFAPGTGEKLLGEVMGQVPMLNGLYRVEHEPNDVAAVVTETVTVERLHRLLGHVAPEKAKAMVEKGVVEGLKLNENSKLISCDSCEYGKAHRKAIGKEREAPQPSEIGDEIHSDVWGPSPVPTINGREYYTTFTDGKSRYSGLDLLRAKYENFKAYKDYEARLWTQKKVRIKKLFSDRGGEYLSKEFSDHLAQAGTVRNLTVHDTPEHNGIAERLNRTLLEKVRAMLHASQLPKFLWGEAVKHAIYLKNRTSTKALDGKTPYEAFFGVKPNLRNLPEFGTKVWVHTPGNSKLEGRSVIGRWVGFDEESSGHRIYSPEKRSISIQRSVKFEPEGVEVYLPHNVPLEGEKEKAPEQPIVSSPRSPITEPEDKPVVDPLGENFEYPPESEGRPKRVRVESAAIRRLRTGEGVISNLPRERGQLPKGIQEGDKQGETEVVEAVDEVEPELWDEMAAIAAAGPEADELEPSYEEARKRSDWPQWKAAIKVELANLKEAGTWEVVERPQNINVVDSKWVFRMKKDAKGNVIKWKARLVARGFTQIYGVDYFETFAPVARLASIRTILAIAARNDWEIDMFDFHSAYLNGILDDGEDIYMEQPPHYETVDRSRYVVKLRKALYGLKQAGRKWYDTLCNSLAELGFKKSMADPAVFYAHVGNEIVILFIHVDDSTITGSSIDLIKEFRARIAQRFEITDLGSISWLLGLAIGRDRAAHTLFISQQSYIEFVIRRFNLEDAKPLTIPVDPNISLSKDHCPETNEAKAEMKGVPYREAIGALNWIAVGSRPDIAFVVGQLAQFLENPGRVHWEAAKRVMRYLKGTKERKLVYGGDEKKGLECFTDADGSSQDHRRAISGFVILVDGAAVSWSSKKQELVTLSTMESEYVATTHAAKELIWLRRLLGEVFRPLIFPIKLHSDNQSAIALARSEGQFHARSKHIDIRWHFIKFCIENKSIELLYCPTEEMIADIFTKPLSNIKAKKFSRGLGLLPV